MFRGSDLLIVSGDDPRLHTAAAEFYGLLWSERRSYRDAVREGGRRLESLGFALPLAEPSIERFLHLGRDGTRRPLAAEHAGDLPEAGDLRPGVLARSPVQDWLFRPVGVVVGPGEVAYLKQLTPGYEALGLVRAPLLPRLFGQLGPAGVGEFTAWAMNVAGAAQSLPAEDLQAAAARVAAAGRHELTAVLQTVTELDRSEAERLAAQVDPALGAAGPASAATRTRTPPGRPGRRATRLGAPGRRASGARPRLLRRRGPLGRRPRRRHPPRVPAALRRRPR